MVENLFVTRIKTNTNYETLEKLILPLTVIKEILKDEIVISSSDKALETGIEQYYLRLVHVYKPGPEQGLRNNHEQPGLEHQDYCRLIKKAMEYRVFFKAIKQNIQIKTFLGTSGNAVRSQIYIAFITYLRSS